MVVELNQPSEVNKPVGMHHVPNTGRKFYWTGKVAVGIRYEQPRHQPTTSETLVQTALLRSSLR